LTTYNSEFLLSKIAVRLTSKLLPSTLTANHPQGSGVIYLTSKNCEYLYVFTALHCIFGDRSIKGGKNIYQYSLENIDHVLVEHNQKLDSVEFHKEKVAVSDIIIDTKNDFCILKVKRTLIKGDKDFPEIVLHSNKRTDGTFKSSGYPGTNRNNHTPLDFAFVSATNEGIMVVRSEGNIRSENGVDQMGGYSGSGLFISKRPILIGMITKIPDLTILGDNVHAKDLSYIEINKILLANNNTHEEVNYTNHAKKIILDEHDNVVDLSRVKISGVTLNLWKAIGNIRTDMDDDWFLDPIRFGDILHSEKMYNIIQKGLVNENFHPSLPEMFSVPKEGFTIRKAVQTKLTDRVIYQAVVDYIANELDRKVLINKVYSARYNYNNATNFKYFFNYSVEQWQKFQHQIHESLDDANPYLVVTDITSFYDNISVAALKVKLDDQLSQASNKPEYTSAVKLVVELIEKWQEHMGYTSNGIPQNRDPSAFLANIFLAHVDMQMEVEFPQYFRFMDDIRIVCKDKYEARKALMFLIDKLSEIGLNLNSQKTKILNRNIPEESKIINEYTPVLDKEIEQICSLMDSGKSREVQIAVRMVNDLFHEAIRNYSEIGSRKKFRFAIERLQRFSRTPLLCDLIDFSEIVKAIIERFEDNPWHTEIYIRFLMTLDKAYITTDLLDVLVPLITDRDKNIYQWQAYSIFKLLAYHKIQNANLLQYAKQLISSALGKERAPEVAGACLYLGSTEDTAVNLIKHAFSKGYFDSYISKRCAILCLQSIEPNNLPKNQMDDVLIEGHTQAYNKFIETGEQAPLIKGPAKLKIQNISRDLPQIISLS
jgi:hypothetical protein